MVDVVFRNSLSLTKYRQKLSLPPTIPPFPAKESQGHQHRNKAGLKRKSTGNWIGFTQQQREDVGLSLLNRKSFIRTVKEKKRTIFDLLHVAIFTVHPGDIESLKFLPYTGPLSIFSIYSNVVKPAWRLSSGNFNVVLKRQFNNLDEFDNCLHNVRQKCSEEVYTTLQPDGFDVSNKLTVIQRISVRKLDTPSSREKLLARLERAVSESMSGVATSPFVFEGDSRSIAENIICQIELCPIIQHQDILSVRVSKKDRRVELANSPVRKKRARSAPNTPGSKKIRKRTEKSRVIFIRATNHPAVAITLKEDEEIETIIKKVLSSIRLPDNEYVLCFDNNVLVTETSQLLMGPIFKIISRTDMLSAWQVPNVQ